MLLIVFVTLAAYESVVGYGLLGFDSYPLILTSRVQSWADFTGTFTEKLMDGRYAGDFYRPVLNLSFALDYAMWKLDATGYQLTNLLLVVGAALAMYAAMRRLLGGGATVAPLLAALSFVLHPALYEVVPVPPRRADTMCGLFMLLALWAQLSPKALGGWRPAVLPAVFALLALGSKETAVGLPAVLFVAVLLYSRRTGWARRLLHACVAMMPVAVALGIAVGARYAVLGGLGGRTASSAIGTQAAVEVVQRLFFPQAVMIEAAWGRWLLVALGAALGLTALLHVCAWWRAGCTKRPVASDFTLRATPDGCVPDSGKGGAPSLRGDAKDTAVAALRSESCVLIPGVLWGRAAVVALVWMIVITAIYLRADRLEVWYYALPLMGFALLVGAAAGRLIGSVRGSVMPERIVAAAGLLLLIVMLGRQAAYSPLVYRYDEWRRATAAGQAFLDELRSRIEAAPDGAVVRSPPMPMRVPFDEKRPTIRGAHVFNDYSVQAWAELVFAGRKVRVRWPGPAAKPASDEVLVLLVPKTTGF